MEIKYFIAAFTFLVVGFLYTKIAKYYFKREVYGEKYLKSWSGKTYYWQGVIFVSSIVTYGIIFVFKINNILFF